MTEEQRKPGRPKKDATVQAIEAVLVESQPSAALLAALVLPQIIATYGAGHVESNFSLLAIQCQQGFRIFHRKIAIRLHMARAIGCDDLRQHKSGQQCGGRFRLANGRLDGLDKFVLWWAAWLAGFFVHIASTLLCL